MLQSVAIAGLVAVSGWVVSPVQRAACVQPRTAAVFCSPLMMADEAPAAAVAEGSAEPMADFTEDLLDALAADETPLSEMDGTPVFVKAEGDVDALEPLGSYTNGVSVDELRAKYQLHENDSGSSQVQIAVLTARIAYMTKHMQENKKDYASLRGLSAMVTRRRKLLEYLLREDLPEFKRLTSELGIRTNQLLKPKLGGARGRRL